MANMFRTTRGGGMFQSPDTQRQYQMADALRSQSMQGAQGFQAPGGYYVAPDMLSGAIAPIAQAFAGKRLEDRAQETEQNRMREISEALRGGNEPPEMLRGPDYNPQSSVDRLSALENNPMAQQYATALRMQEAAREPEGTYQTLAPEQAEQLGLGPGVWQMGPQGQIERAYEPEQPEEPGMLVQNEQGEWVPNPSYIQAKSQIAAAGKPDPINMDFSNMLGGDKMQEEQGKTLGKYLGDEFVKIQEQSSEAAQQNQNLDRLSNLLEGVTTGRGVPTLTNIQGLANTFGVKVGEDLGAKEAAESLTNQIALRFRNPESGMGLPGATSDRDISFLKSLPPGIQQSPEGRELITESFKKVNQKKIDVANKARELVQKNAKEGVNGLTWQDMDTLQGMWQEPMFDDSFVERANKLTGGETEKTEEDPEIEELLNRYAPQ